MSTTTRTLATKELFQAGQSPWLDFISREILRSGKLRSWVEDSGLMGVTSNPSIFEKAISQPGGGYEKDIRRMFAAGKSTFEVYDALTLADIRRTCDLFLPVYKRTQGEHGFVSLEVMPSLAHDAQRTLAEARRLFKAVLRPNVLIKIPATPEGLPAIRAALSEGININITLMFSLKHYKEVAHAYLEGLANYSAKRAGDLRQIHSVASVFVSRIDTYVDKKLEVLSASAGSSKDLCQSLKGKAAVANSKLIYQAFKEIFNSEKFKKLHASGARVQKVLWGSTSTKNPSYSDLIYVENLVGAETVNTMPLNTLEALLDHGIIRPNTLEEGLQEARSLVADLKRLGLNLLEVGEALQREGVKAFSDSFDALMRTLEHERARYQNKKKKSALILVGYSLPSSAPLTLPSPPSTEGGSASGGKGERVKGEGKIEDLRTSLLNFQEQNKLERFFKKDPSLWKEDAAHQEVIQNRLGWLDLPDWMLGKLYEIELLRQELLTEKIKNIVLLGMGGSSLAPEVLGQICKPSLKASRFYVLDSTDPATILNLEKKINLKSTFFIVSSKSGGTIETLSQFRYFYSRVEKACGKKAADKTGKYFIAITDEGSPLDELARQKKFRKVFLNPLDVGGRYSALSYFGMVPAGLLGIDLRSLLNQAREFLSHAKAEKRIEKNLGLYLGIVLGSLAKSGRDKVTFWLSPRLRSFGSWLEQLIAESTGKEGKGVVPVEGESYLDWKDYGKDRVFVVIRLRNEKSPILLRKVKEAKKAGFPVIEIEWPDRAAIGQAFLQWEIATAVMGIELEINPFDEPNVKESKENTAELLSQRHPCSVIPAKAGIQILDSRLSATKKADPSFGGKSCGNDNLKLVEGVPGQAALDSFFSQTRKGGYLALLSYTEPSKNSAGMLHNIQHSLASRLQIPVLLGFGPRYLHSTGQLYKGGAKNGIFLIFLTQEPRDLKIPGEVYTFGQLKRAQALGDLRALQNKGLPVLALDLGKNWHLSLKKFTRALKLAPLKQNGFLA